MNRQIVIVVALFALAALVTLVLAGRGGRTRTAQKAEPTWKIVYTLPKTNGTAPFPNTNAFPRTR
jgi:hypothetical protein